MKYSLRLPLLTSALLAISLITVGEAFFMINPSQTANMDPFISASKINLDSNARPIHLLYADQASSIPYERITKLESEVSPLRNDLLQKIFAAAEVAFDKTSMLRAVLSAAISKGIPNYNEYLFDLMSFKELVEITSSQAKLPSEIKVISTTEPAVNFVETSQIPAKFIDNFNKSGMDLRKESVNFGIVLSQVQQAIQSFIEELKKNLAPPDPDKFKSELLARIKPLQDFVDQLNKKYKPNLDKLKQNLQESASVGSGTADDTAYKDELKFDIVLNNPRLIFLQEADIGLGLTYSMQNKDDSVQYNLYEYKNKYTVNVEPAKPIIKEGSLQYPPPVFPLQLKTSDGATIITPNYVIEEGQLVLNWAITRLIGEDRTGMPTAYFSAFIRPVDNNSFDIVIPLAARMLRAPAKDDTDLWVKRYINSPDHIIIHIKDLDYDFEGSLFPTYLKYNYYVETEYKPVGMNKIIGRYPPNGTIPVEVHNIGNSN